VAPSSDDAEDFDPVKDDDLLTSAEFFALGVLTELRQMYAEHNPLNNLLIHLAAKVRIQACRLFRMRFWRVFGKMPGNLGTHLLNI
jgi:hypothetical protein